MSGTTLPSVRFEFLVELRPVRRRQVKPPAAGATKQPPRLRHALLAGHQIERRLRDDPTQDYASFARATGVSRARVTQIVGLTLLAPDIQEAILTDDSQAMLRLSERALRPVTAEPIWERQRELWNTLLGQTGKRQPKMYASSSSPARARLVWRGCPFTTLDGNAQNQRG